MLVDLTQIYVNMDVDDVWVPDGTEEPLTIEADTVEAIRLNHKVLQIITNNSGDAGYYFVKGTHDEIKKLIKSKRSDEPIVMSVPPIRPKEAIDL